MHWWRTKKRAQTRRSCFATASAVSSRIQYNTFYNGYHTTGPDIETGSNVATGNLDEIYVRNNLIYDDPNRTYRSEGVFVQGPHGGTGQIFGFHFYDNVVKFPLDIGLSMEDVDEAYIYNNTFYGNNAKNAGNYQVFFDDGCTHQVVKNNIFYTLLPNDVGGSGAAMVASNQDLAEIDSDYNLYYRINGNLRIVFVDGAVYYTGDMASIRSNLGWETHSPAPADPLFVSPTDYHLQPGSPAINAGTDVGLPFQGSAPDIGAFESSL